MGKLVWNIHYRQEDHKIFNNNQFNSHMQAKECLQAAQQKMV